MPVLQELSDPSKNERPVKIVDGWNAWFYSDLQNLKKIWPGTYSHTVPKSKNITWQNRSPNFFDMWCSKCNRTLWKNNLDPAQPSHPFWQKSADWLNWPC